MHYNNYMKLLASVEILLVSLLIGTPAFAEQWNQILTKLRQSGVNRVGAMNIDELQNEISQNVQWKEIDRSSRPLFSGSRRSAYYVINNNIVYKAKDLPENLKPVQPQLDLHEALGALGYQDQTYSMSTSLDIISRARNENSRRHMVETLGASVFTKENLQRLKALSSEPGSGSGTGVGGGGDITALYIKSIVLNNILGTPGINSTEVLKYYPFINFEPQYNPKEQYISLKYEFRFGDRKGEVLEGVPVHPKTGDQERLSVWVPVLDWAKSKAVRKRLIDDVSLKLIELFPLQAVPSAQTVNYETCRNQSVTYVQPSTMSVYDIQNFRAFMITGCTYLQLFDTSNKNLSSMAVKTPSFDENFRAHFEAPYYTCHTRENGKIKSSYIFNEVHPRASGEHGELHMPVDGGFNFDILGYIYRNKKLEITHIGFVNTRKGSKEIARYNGRNQSYKVVHNGKNYSLACIRKMR